MPTLIETLIDYEADMLAMIAEQWGVDQDLDAGKSQSKQIAKLLADEELIYEIWQALPQQASNALIRLLQNNGRLPFDRFTREFGDLREMGAARRDKVRPDRHPQSTTELLFYKGLIARAFFKQGKDTLEFVFIPDEILHFLEKEISSQHTASVPILPGNTPARSLPADDGILEHACTFLAAIRAGIPRKSLAFERPTVPYDFLLHLLIECGLLDQKGLAQPQKIGAFLEAPRQQTFSLLSHTWQESQVIDETKLLTNLDFEGGMKIDPLSLRKKVFATLQSLPNANWLEIGEFRTWMRTYQPDFLRTGGEYESWIIKDKITGQYLKGFESWGKIEGALLDTMIRGPFFWLGLVDLGAKTRNGLPNLFRPSAWMANLLSGENARYEKQPAVSFTLNKDGRILIERAFPLSIRYQIARFCEWKEEKKERYIYQISHPALQNAKRQGLQINQFTALIQKYGKKPLPPNITGALERWKQNELEAVIEQTVLLRVRSKAVLDQLMASRAKAYILARLNDTSAVVKRNSVSRVKDVLLDLGILADVRLEV